MLHDTIYLFKSIMTKPINVKNVEFIMMLIFTFDKNR